MNHQNILLLALTGAGFLSACNSGSSNSGSTFQNPQAQLIPQNYQCLPSSLPNANNNLKLAYAGNCGVESATESNNLQAMAVALEQAKLDLYNKGYFGNNCTGTPIQYNSNTGIGFVVTAAHCVLSAKPEKPAGTKITSALINIYESQPKSGHNSAWIYQGYKASPIMNTGELTAEITAVYAPTQFCESSILYKNECVNPQKANGDIAVLKIKTQPGKALATLPNLIVAPANFSLINNGVNNQLLILGYGTSNSTGQNINPENPYLYYLNSRYYATNYAISAYGNSSPFPVFDAPNTILNGYSINNTSYSLICNGDSGGGDFAWDGSKWNLVGVHSWSGAGGNCGEFYPNTNAPTSVSTDARQFNNWIQTIVTQDIQPDGCANLGESYVCASGNGI